jgi:hypothetical protein
MVTNTKQIYTNKERVTPATSYLLLFITFRMSRTLFEEKQEVKCNKTFFLLWQVSVLALRDLLKG